MHILEEKYEIDFLFKLKDALQNPEFESEFS